MIFRGWQKSSLIERPGKVVSILWVGGCNFRCPWCYNRDLVLNPEKLPLIKEKEILDFLKTRQGLLDGIMITGGEPTLQKELPIFIKKIRNLGFSAGIETNGTNPEMIEKLIKDELIDFITLDVKAPLEKQIYNKITGVEVNLDKIRESIEIIKNSELDYEFRSTVVPILAKSDILKIVQQLHPVESPERGIRLNGELFNRVKGVKKYVLQQFSPNDTVLKKDYKSMKPYSDENLKEMQKEAEKFIKNIELRI